MMGGRLINLFGAPAVGDHGWGAIGDTGWERRVGDRCGPVVMVMPHLLIDQLGGVRCFHLSARCSLQTAWRASASQQEA